MNGVNIVTRKIRVEHLDNGSRNMVARLRTVEGVLDASASPETSSVIVTYDLRQVALPEVADRLGAIGLRPSNHLLHRLRRGWASFMEGNIRSNLAHQGHCCSKPPAGR